MSKTIEINLIDDKIELKLTNDEAKALATFLGGSTTNDFFEITGLDRTDENRKLSNCLTYIYAKIAGFNKNID